MACTVRSGLGSQGTSKDIPGDPKGRNKIRELEEERRNKDWTGYQFNPADPDNYEARDKGGKSQQKNLGKDKGKGATIQKKVADEEDPILKAVPPETDYITYLTILEYQLNEQRLPSLLRVLQDDTLTENIGWDLVHLLMPMLPNSKNCLDLIARKGNPREVIIRATEYLSSLGSTDGEPDPASDDDLRTFEGEVERIHLGDMVLEGLPHSAADPASKPLEGHRKSEAPGHLAFEQASMPDPEPDDDFESVDEEEKALIRQLLQAVCFEIFEDYLTYLDGDPKGLSWSTRLRETMFPHKVLPGSTALTLYQTSTDLRSRDATVEKLLETCILLGLHPNAIFEELVPSRQDNNSSPLPEEPDSPKEYPTDPKDIPFSSTGSIAFLAAYGTAAICRLGLKTGPLPFGLLSKISDLNQHFVHGDTLAGNSDAVIDAILAVNLMSLEYTGFLETYITPDAFLAYVKPLVLFSADSEDSEWRFTSHLIVTQALKSQTNSEVKLQVIRTYLGISEIGPRLLLRGSAVGWLKDTILADSQVGADNASTRANTIPDHIVISEMLEEVFWDISDFIQNYEEDLTVIIAPALSVIATTLNFYYFLVSSDILRNKLQISLDLTDPSSLATQAAARFIEGAEGLLKKAQSLDGDIGEILQRDVMRQQVIMGVFDLAIDISTNPRHTKWLAALALVGEAVLCALIVLYVPSTPDTEIDWKTYMQHVQLFIKGERNYKNISGDTGPLVYPALHVYIYSMLYYLTDDGTSIFKAQILFTCLYLVTLALVLSCYRKAGAPPYLLIPLVLSKRLHSIFLLRLFNDGWAAFFFWLSIWSLQRKKWLLGALAWAAGVGVKMTVLLALPAIGAIVLQGAGQQDSLIIAALVAQLQLGIGLTFMMNGNATSYFSRAFELNRQFLYKWTVNWKMMSEEFFLSKGFAIFLLAYHVVVLGFFLNDRWLHPSSKNVVHFIRQYRKILPEGRETEIAKKITPMFVMEAMLGTCLALQVLGLWFGSKSDPEEVVGGGEKGADETQTKPHSE
ncbi:putative dolichyl-p-man:man cpp-dolichyl mannosyltransferase [Phaeomoniella chlamydospora]|uniref:Dol-P-Man:Man(5)GlcNAc(2)-PP-Dol alpha-1,3-mannosyltransferase n=1 Tax=Phaeomoniella chlamydospora TaxID=158046 RepID=A0A0G2HG68_PHACM|nr:putative dolichyl-p-man:man cpp-dolichyl mannosyltransferase [Phaeomoniella chlamydospora]